MLKQHVRARAKNKWEAFDVIVFIFLTFFAVLIFYPFYNALLTSIVSVKQYVNNPVMLIPPEIMLDNYRFLLSKPIIYSGYANTLYITIVGTIYSMLLTVMMAYGFSRRTFPGKRVLFSLVLFTMFFSGGMVPFYLQLRSLKLLNKLSTIILMNGVSVYNVIVIKSSFEQIPESIEEAAHIDGANDLVIFARIMLPLSMPILATFTLFISVAHWNHWFWPMLILNDSNQYPLQVVLRSIVYESTSDTEIINSAYAATSFAQGVKMAAVMVTMLPVMAIYPFVQKYFVKGILVGAIKM